MVYIGTASWNIPKNEMSSFPNNGNLLEKYSTVFNAVEINSSFYKDHLAYSYQKWGRATPDQFRFSVKLHQRFTHTCMDASTIDLSNSLEAMTFLEDKWRVLLVQFPAGKKFSAINMNKIYKIIRKRFNGLVALESRNPEWNCLESQELMKEFDVLKVSADPEKCPGFKSQGNKYYRLHGSPEIYHSSYTDDYLDELYLKLKKETHEGWCIFNNTADGYAISNARKLMDLSSFQREHAYTAKESLNPMRH